uniref:Uncharacterized protein n=1 Tax=Oryza brachyantha TaxID=4533 RepID=J3N7W7_ORYBR
MDRAPILDFTIDIEEPPCIGSMAIHHLCSVESGMIGESREVDKEKTTAHTEEELNDVLSTGSDTDDISLLKKKYKSLKRKHLKCNKFIPNAKIKDGIASALDNFHEEH